MRTYFPLPAYVLVAFGAALLASALWHSFVVPALAKPAPFEFSVARDLGPIVRPLPAHVAPVKRERPAKNRKIATK